MLTLLVAIERQLVPLVGARGFTLTDESAAEHLTETNVHLVSFRAGSPGRPLVLLDLCHVVDQQTIVAELWSPDDLAREHAPVTDRVAMRRRVWEYDSSDDLTMTVQAIVGEVVGWVEASDSDRPAR